jgi:hypothetical protein
MSGDWCTPVLPLQYNSAAIALAETDTARRGENDSRLRLLDVKYNEQFDDLFLCSGGTTVDLALSYVSFTQLCKVVGLSPQAAFLRELKSGTAAEVLEQYTDKLKATPTEVKLVVRRASKPWVFGSVKSYYSIKRLSTRNSGSNTPTERWLFWLAQFEQYGWLHAMPLLLQDDYLVAVMYDKETIIKVGDGQVCLGFMVANSEAGITPPRSSAIVYWPDTQQWLPVNEPTVGKQLTQGLAEALEGSIGMFGPLSNFKAAVIGSMLSTTLTAHATMTVDDITAHKLLTTGGLSPVNAIKCVAGLKRNGKGNITNLSTLLEAAREPQLDLTGNSHGTVTGIPGAVQSILQLGWALWK